MHKGKENIFRSTLTQIFQLFHIENVIATADDLALGVGISEVFCGIWVVEMAVVCVEFFDWTADSFSFPVLESVESRTKECIKRCS